MNKNNAKDYLPLVQALAEGKQIQFGHENYGWKDVDNVIISNPASSYRIKPEPLMIYVVMDSQDLIVRYGSTNRGWADWQGARKFVEVIED